MKLTKILFLLLFSLISCQSFASKDYNKMTQKWKDTDRNSLEEVRKFKSEEIDSDKNQNVQSYFPYDWKKFIEEILYTEDKLLFESVSNDDWNVLSKKNPKFHTGEYKSKFETLRNTAYSNSLIAEILQKKKISRDKTINFDSSNCKSRDKDDYTCKERDLFYLAHQNEREFKDIENRLSYSGNEFDFQKDKKKFLIYRSKKHVTINTIENYYLENSEYDFQKKGYYFWIDYQSNVFGEVKIPLLSSPKFFIPVKEDSVDEFWAHFKKGFVLLATIEPKTESFEYIRFQEPGYGVFYFGMEKMELIKEKRYDIYAKVQKDKFRTYKMNVLDIRFKSEI